MEIDLLRTFYEVNRMRSFTRAAENLFLTPSAVSARIRQLEAEIGSRVFKRSSQLVVPTAAGERLLRHAIGILDAWERAQKDLVFQEKPHVTLAGVASFWDIFLQQWLHRVRGAIPALLPWVEVSTAARIAEKLALGYIDLGFLYSPPALQDLVLREMAKVKLVLVSSREGVTAKQAMEKDYVVVDWGTLFATEHAHHFPQRPFAAARSNSARVAWDLLRVGGGSAYLPEAMLENDLRTGTLHLVENAPVFEMTVYAAYAARNEHRELIEEMLALPAG